MIPTYGVQTDHGSHLLTSRRKERIPCPSGLSAAVHTLQPTPRPIHRSRLHWTLFLVPRCGPRRSLSWSSTRICYSPRPPPLLCATVLPVALLSLIPCSPVPVSTFLDRHLVLLEDARSRGIPAARQALEDTLRQETAVQAAAVAQAVTDGDPQARAAVEQLAQALAHDPTALATLLGVDPQDPRLAELSSQREPAGQLAAVPPTGAEPVSEAPDSEIPTWLDPLLDQIESLTAPEDQPRKITLLRQVIQQAEAHQVEAPLWADVQIELGNALQDNPHGTGHRTWSRPSPPIPRRWTSTPGRLSPSNGP